MASAAAAPAVAAAAAFQLRIVVTGKEQMPLSCKFATGVSSYGFLLRTYPRSVYPLHILFPLCRPNSIHLCVVSFLPRFSLTFSLSLPYYSYYLFSVP